MQVGKVYTSGCWEQETQHGRPESHGQGVYFQNCERVFEGFFGYLALSSAEGFTRFLVQCETVYLEQFGRPESRTRRFLVQFQTVYCKGEGVFGFGFLAVSSAEGLRRFLEQFQTVYCIAA